MAVLDLGAERINRPGRSITKGHYVGMPVEAETPRGALLSPSGEEIGDPAAIDPRALETGGTEFLLQNVQRTALFGRHRSASDQARGQRNRINRRNGHHLKHSKKSETVLT